MAKKFAQLTKYLSTQGKGFLLFMTMVAGAFVPQAHIYSFMIRYLLMAMLFFAFMDIELKMRPLKKGVFSILVANLVIAFGAYFALRPFGLEFALVGFLTAISPTATASVVIVNFVEGDMEFIVDSVVLTNLVVALILPFALPALMGSTMQISPWEMLQSVATVVLVPMLLAQLAKKLPSAGYQFIRKGKRFSMLLWLSMLFIVVAKASDFLRNENTASLTTLFYIALIALVLAVLDFGVGILLGRPERWRESGQALGQKNLSFTIWVGLTFINPLVAMGPTIYIIYHNLYNSWLIYHFEKNRLKPAEIE